MSDQFEQRRRRRLSSVNFAWLLPNLITLASLSCGMTAIRFAFADRFEAAVLLVALAGILDALDGRMARLLKSSGNFGAQLDSLCDMVVFGVVPALMLYLFALEDAGRIAWGACIFYAACCALRLARFNSELHDTPTWAANYFTGIPSPAAAFIVLLPIIASFRFDAEVLRESYFLAAWLVVIGIGAISTIATFAGKGIKLPRALALPALGFFVLVVAMLISRPWDVLIALGVIYVALIPASIIRFNRIKANALKSNADVKS